MARHVKAFTYEPKIPYVLTGKCRQTIRPQGKKPVKVGDTILFHGWEGKPYWSKWSWRREFEITTARKIIIYPHGINLYPAFLYIANPVLGWHSNLVNDLARLDYIQPATGEALGKLLNSMYDLNGGKPFQIIRW